jgi:hypothetical protein
MHPSLIIYPSVLVILSRDGPTSTAASTAGKAVRQKKLACAADDELEHPWWQVGVTYKYLASLMAIHSYGNVPKSTPSCSAT